MAWRALIDTHDPEAPERPLALADRVRLRARSSLILAEAPRRRRAFAVRTADAPRRSTRSRAPRASPANGGTSAASARSSRRRPRSRFWPRSASTSASEAAGARQPDARSSTRRAAAACPSRSCCASASRWSRPLRDVPERRDARIECEDGGDRRMARSRPATASGATCPTDARVAERTIALPDLPIGRYRLIVDGVECALTVAPPECLRPRGGVAQAVRRRRPALRPARAASGDQGIGDFSTLGARRRGGGRRRRGLSRRQPDAHAVPARPRAGEPLPSRPTGASSIRSSSTCSTRGPAARRGGRAPRSRRSRRPSPRPRRPGSSTTRRSGAPSARRSRRCSAAFARVRAARPGDPLVADYRAFVETGRRDLAALRRLPGDRRRARPARTGGSGRRRCATAKPKAIDEAIERNRRGFEFALFCQWLADRQLGAGGGAGARARPRDRLLPRSRGRRRAGRRRSLGARRRAGARRRRSARRPIRSPPRGRTGTCRRPIRSPARARAGRRSSALYRANMRHAGMLRIDHAMGLQRLFLIPEGAKPAEGAYLAYPLDDLIGHIALESQRAAVHGGRRGPRHGAGGLPRPDDAGQHPRACACCGSSATAREVLPPAAYPPLSVACVATHDLATLAGWWRGADIAERLVARPPDAGRGGRGDRRAARGEARPHRRACSPPA